MSGSRQTELSNLKEFLSYGNKEITMILQNLQWNRQTLNSRPMVTCSYDGAHKIPNNKLKEHEEYCMLKSQEYSKDEKLFPTFPEDTPTIVKLNSDDIKKIIDKASKNNPEFKKAAICPSLINEKYFIKVLGKSWNGPPPLTLERLQAMYTADERRAIYDEVVASDPTCHNLSDLALLDTNEAKTEKKSKSRLEILSELRDMRRRRTKYRVAAKTKKYSDVLRDVIKTQMEMYTGGHSEEHVSVEASCSLKKLHNDIETLSVEKNNKKQKFHQEINSSKSSNSRYDRSLEKEKDTFSLNIKTGTQYDERNRRGRYDKKYESRTYGKNSEHEKNYSERNHCWENNRRYRDELRDRNTRDYKREERPVSHSKQNQKDARYAEKPRKRDNSKSYSKYKREYSTGDCFRTPENEIRIKKEREDNYESAY